MKILKTVVTISILIGWMSSMDAGYLIKAGKRSRSAIDRLEFKNVADMCTIAQDPAYYARQLRPMSAARQKFYDREYDKAYFSPWKLNKMEESEEELFWQIRFVQKKKIYDGKKRLIPPKKWQWWIKNSNFEKLNTVKGRAISVRHSDMRAFPTDTPAYRNPWTKTEGFPFDYNQHSELHPNVPLFVSHYSLDGRWAFVQAAHANGWVKVKDIAIVDTSFIKSFKTGRYGIAVKDDLFLYDGRKKISIIKLSTIFPYCKSGKCLLTAARNKKGRAVIRKIPLPSRDLVAPKPLPFTRKNVAKIVRELYNEPYGWGGKMQTRDCSATTRDYFAVFGIFLKRNSAKQAKAGKSISIKGLPKEKKKATIIKKAKAFQSMLYVPGHITLYLGRYKDEPVVMHTYWGVRLTDWSKYPLCRTIITTTEPGKELKKIREKSKLINTLQKIINF